MSSSFLNYYHYFRRLEGDGKASNRRDIGKNVGKTRADQSRKGVKLEGLSNEINSIRIEIDRLSSMTSPVANTSTTGPPNILKPRMKSGENNLDSFSDF